MRSAFLIHNRIEIHEREKQKEICKTVETTAMCLAVSGWLVFLCFHFISFVHSDVQWIWRIAKFSLCSMYASLVFSYVKNADQVTHASHQNLTDFYKYHRIVVAHTHTTYHSAMMNKCFFLFSTEYNYQNETVNSRLFSADSQDIHPIQVVFLSSYNSKQSKSNTVYSDLRIRLLWFSYNFRENL